MHTRMQAVEILHLAVCILTLPPIVIGVTLLLMYALEGFLTLRELLVCELFLLLIPIAAGLLLLFGGPAMSPMLAGAAMAASSVSVVLNALRLRRAGGKGQSTDVIQRSMS